MPPRKSDASKATTAAATTIVVVAGDEGAGTPVKETKEKEGRGDGVNIEDLNLPKSIVTRLAKGVLPPNTQIQGNAMLAMSKSATVFVNYLASAANAHAQKAQRKTISPQDVFAALQDDLEFPDFVPRLEAELAKFNEISTEKRNTYRKKVAADKAADKSGAAGDAEEADEAMEEAARDSNGQPAAKKARRGSGPAEEVGDADGRDVEEPEAEEEEEEDDDDDGQEEDEEEEEEALAAMDREEEMQELARADEMDGNDDEQEDDDSESD